MSVLLVQRPQPTPGLLMLNSRQLQQKSQRRQPIQRAPCQQTPVIRRKSPAVVAVPPTHSPPVQTATQPRTQRKSSPPRKAQAQTTTPSTPPLTPAQQPKRRSRPSPKSDSLSRSLGASPFPVEEGGLPEWDSPPKTGSQRSKRNSNKDDSPSTWQQAAFVKPSPIPALDIASLMGKEAAPLGGSFSTPTSPVRGPAVAATQPAITRSPTMPVFPSLEVRRLSSHTRTPSYPTLPMHREKDTFNMNGGSNALEAFLNLSIHDTNPFARVKPASLGSSPGIHARMAKNHKKNGPIFASASFQHAPEAMTLPKPFFRMGASRETSDASSDEGVVDLAEEQSSGEDESSDSSYTPAFLL